jgi:protease II
MRFGTYCFHKISLLPFLLILPACNNPRLPSTEKIPVIQVIYGVNYTDPYKYLENSNDPKTVSYIVAENEYAEHYFDHISKLKYTLLKEFGVQHDYEKQAGSIQELIGGYFYYQRIPDGKNFPVYYRKLKDGDAKEETVLD